MAKRSSIPLGSRARRLLAIDLTEESGMVVARQHARQVARLLGFSDHDQIRIATATSEIARNAVQYAKGGRVEFSIDDKGERPSLIVTVSDEGPGIADTEAILEGRYRSQTGMGLGISSTRRLMDQFSFESAPGMGVTVTFGKALPTTTRKLDVEEIARLAARLAGKTVPNAFEELKQQNQDLLTALGTVQQREGEIQERQDDLARLNQELEDTNRGVVALYAELEERAAALRRADQIKSRFLSHMSHEFRTPLNSIVALSELLLHRVDGDLAPEQEKQVAFIRRAAQELFEMVNDLLDIAKVEAGKVDVRKGPVDAGKLFGTLRGMLRPLATHDAVSLIFEAPGDVLIDTDEAKLGQILRNLISNALKFTESGEIRVSVRCDDREAIFSVSDTGIGIALEDQELIFQEFSQVDNPLQRKIKGTGLGLPLSRRLAELLGGSLTVESEPGMGSTFTLRLPLSCEVNTDRVAEGDEETLVAGLSRRRHDSELASNLDSILVIDDEEVARYLVRQMLRGTRYLVTEAKSGIEGLERARFDQPRLIVLDLAMPDRSGFEVLEDLKADPGTQHIPVVIHTSRTLSPEDFARLGGRHAAVLPKEPGNRELAFAVIRELLAEPSLFTGARDTEVSL